MDSLKRLCEVVKIVTPKGEVRLVGEPAVEDHWRGSVIVGNITLIEVDVGPIEEVVQALIQKMEKIGIRLHSSIRPPRS